MKASKEIGTYLLHNKETDETYVGSGVLSDREYDHFYKLQNNKHANKKLQEAYNKNPNFDFVDVKTETRDEAFDFEQSILDEFKGNPLLLNIVLNARYGPPPNFKPSLETIERLRSINIGRKHTEETKRKVAEASKGRTHNLGRILTKEHKEKISESLMGHKVSNETKEKQRQGNLGKIVSEETKEKLRLHNLGNKHTEESKEKMSLAHKGIPKTQEWKDKIGEGNKGKIISKEQRDKVSKVHKGKIISQEQKEKLSIKVTINGVNYNSMTEAANSLGLKKSTVSNRIKNSNFKEWERSES